MKIIFLDIDGVFNHTGYFKRSDKHPLQEFDPHAVQLLKEILEATNAKIVVSSTWRRIWRMNVRKLQKGLFSHYGLSRYVIGVTPRIKSWDSIRGDEIRAYIQNVPHPITNFIIIDDDDDMGEYMSHLVQTSRNGLTPENRDEAIRMLGRDV